MIRHSTSIFNTEDRSPAAVIYQDWVSGALANLSKDDRAVIRKRILALELSLKKLSGHELEGAVEELNELRKILGK